MTVCPHQTAILLLGFLVTLPSWEEEAYSKEVIHLQSWCRENNLLLNASKTKELTDKVKIKVTFISVAHLNNRSIPNCFTQILIKVP